jgi:hypothetical protein
VNGKYVHAYLVGDILLWSECRNFLVYKESYTVCHSIENIISAPQLMKNQDNIKDNYVELWYKGTGLKMRMKTSENLYIFIGK